MSREQGVSQEVGVCPRIGECPRKGACPRSGEYPGMGECPGSEECPGKCPICMASPSPPRPCHSPARSRMTWSSRGSSEKCGIRLAHSTSVKSCLSAAWQMLVTGSFGYSGGIRVGHSVPEASILTEHSQTSPAPHTGPMRGAEYGPQRCPVPNPQNLGLCDLAWHMGLGRGD